MYSNNNILTFLRSQDSTHRTQDWLSATPTPKILQFVQIAVSCSPLWSICRRNATKNELRKFNLPCLASEHLTRAIVAKMGTA